MRCEECDRETKRLILSGPRLLCQSCHSRPTLERSSYVQDDIPGGMTLENVGAEPVTVFSYSEMDRLLESRGLRRKEKWCPTPGTNRDPAGVQDSRKYMDPQTLENATTLILRAQGAIAKETQELVREKEWQDRAFRPEQKELSGEQALKPYFDELDRRR